MLTINLFHRADDVTPEVFFLVFVYRRLGILRFVEGAVSYHFCIGKTNTKALAGLVFDVDVVKQGGVSVIFLLYQKLEVSMPIAVLDNV